MGFKRVDCGYSQLNFHAYFIVSLELRYVMAITSFSERVLCSVTSILCFPENRFYNLLKSVVF